MTNQLIEELLAGPEAFEDAGRGYELLQEYFHGLSHETLPPLLGSSVPAVKRIATYLLSELGRDARDVVDDAIPLLDCDDRDVTYYVMEAIAVCSDVERPERFAHVLGMLNCKDSVLRQLSMYLASRVAEGTLLSGVDAVVDPTHAIGRSLLLSRADADVIGRTLDDPDLITRSYAAIAAKRSKASELLAKMAASDDEEIRILGAST